MAQARASCVASAKTMAGMLVAIIRTECFLPPLCSQVRKEHL